MPEQPEIKPQHVPAESNLEPVVQTRVERFAESVTCKQGWIASEAPLEVRIGNTPITFLMRTPGNDEELVRGFLYGEGLIKSEDDLLSIGPSHLSPEDVGGSVINVQFTDWHEHFGSLDRAFYSNASCGVCGKKTISSFEVKGAIASSQIRMR